MDNLSPPGWQNIALMSYYGNQFSQVLLKNDHINFQLNSPFNNIFFNLWKILLAESVHKENINVKLLLASLNA
jgi:hypothetical protein